MLDWPSPPRLDAVVRRASEFLSGSPTAMLDARVLAKSAFDLDDAGLIAGGRRLVDAAGLARYAAMLERRRRREPVAYITGRREFWSLDFEMAPGVLVPRADSEVLIEAVIVRRDAKAPLRLLDLGCGSGALLCALLVAFPQATGMAVDINPAAAALTKRNLARLGIGGRSQVIVASWGDALAGGYDVAISNPPYIPAGDIGNLPRDVKDFEDPRALFSGDDGLGAYRRILEAAPALLETGGLMALEIGDNQVDSLRRLAADAFPQDLPSIVNDLNGRPRGLIIDLASAAK